MYRVMVVAVVAAWLAAGCTKRNPAVCCTTQEDCERSGLPTPTECGDALVCLSNTCQLPPTCQADSDCSGDLLCDVLDGMCVQCLDSSTCGGKICDAAAHRCRNCETDADCPNGFCEMSTMTCRLSIIPNYVPTACDDTSESDLVITTDTLIDTSDASSCTGGVIAQDGPEICVVRFRSILVEGGFTLSARGPRAIALVADTKATIEGIFDIDAHGMVDGPGGGTVISGGAAASGAGGGGAGMATSGGSGGTTATDGGANNAGVVESSPEAGPLVGGTRAGGNEGGGGGGAATIVACRGAMTVTGVISANGGGGGSVPVGSGGTGGGAGGYVALQGRTVVMLGRAFANGGSGSIGALPDAPSPTGVDGLRSSAACAFRAGNGGAGGCLSSPPLDGGKGDDTIAQPGGGGGSVGFFAAFSPLGGSSMSPREASPPFSGENVIETR